MSGARTDTIPHVSQHTKSKRGLAAQVRLRTLFHRHRRISLRWKPGNLSHGTPSRLLKLWGCCEQVKEAWQVWPLGAAGPASARSAVAIWGRDRAHKKSCARSRGELQSCRRFWHFVGSKWVLNLPGNRTFA